MWVGRKEPASVKASSIGNLGATVFLQSGEGIGLDMCVGMVR